MSKKKSWGERLNKWCNGHEWLLVLVLIVIALRLPSLFTPHYYGDEEIYFVMGRAWREGVPLYQEMFDHKPPLIYIMAGVLKTVYLFRLGLLLSMVAHTVLFWKLARLFWTGKRKKLAYISSLLFVGLTTLPTLEGNIVNAELLMMLPITASLVLLWKAKKSDWRRYLVAGLVAGVGWLYKVPVMFDVLAIGLYLLVFREKTLGKSLKALVKPSFWAFFGGFTLPLLSTFVYYYLKGHGPAYLATVLTVNLSYVSSWETSTWAFNPLKSGLIVRGMTVGMFTLLLYILRNKLDKRLVLGLLWLSWSYFGAMLSGRPYPHYLQQPVVPFSLVAPLILVTEKALGWAMIGYLAIWGILTSRQIGWWGYPNAPLYVNFGKFLTGKIDKQEYLESFDGARRNYALGEYLNERMAPEDKLYVWGSDAALYNITDKLPAGGKYIVNFHVHDLKKHDYVMENLRENSPLYIVVLPGTTEFAQLDELLEREYLETTQVEGAKVYKRVSEVLGRQAVVE